MRKPLLLFTLALGLPCIAQAQSIAGPGCGSVMSSIPCFASGLGHLFGVATAALIGVAIVVYFFGIVKGLWGASSGSAATVKDLRNQLLWGLIALFVVLSIFGILSLLGYALFGTNNFNSLL